MNYAAAPGDILDSCDSLIILTEWKEFLKYKPADFIKLKESTVFDGRNCFDPTQMLYSGIKYFCIGRNLTKSESEKNFCATKDENVINL